MAPRARSRRKSSIRQRKSARSSARAWLIGIGLLAAAGLLFHLALNRMAHPRIDSNDVAQVQLGEQVYANACVSCHGASLEGQQNWQTRLPEGHFPAPPLNASGRAWRHSDRLLFAITKRGASAYPAGYKTEMPAFARTLTDEEIAAALAYVESHWTPEMRAKHARRSLAFWVTQVH